MTSLGELATYLPDSGSFSTYGTRFVSPAFGFAIGWNFWYNWAVTIAAELSAATVIIKYWFPEFLDALEPPVPAADVRPELPVFAGLR